MSGRDLTPVRAGLGVDASVGQTETLDGLAADQVLFHNLRGVRGLYVAIPDGLGIDHNRGAVLALIETAGFVDAHGAAEAGGLRELLQLGEELAFPIGRTGWAWRIGRACVLADKNMMLKGWQSGILLGK